MFVLIWGTLLFCLRSGTADTGTSVETRRYCSYDFCITLSKDEIIAEAGLCVVIPCSFTTYHRFTPRNIVWYKCTPTKPRCDDSDIIFNTNRNSRMVQSGFQGRVSLLEPDVSQGNCSIIINDLKESDSGSYQLRVNGILYETLNGFTYSLKAAISIKGLSQKPTVTVPALTAGQPTNLTCTAPGLCSGAQPEITWMWRGAGEQDPRVSGGTAVFETVSLTAVAQRHSSVFTFNPSAEHHGASVTCKVSFAGDVTAEETVTLNVTYVQEFRITGDVSVKEGETVNLTCSVDTFPPSRVTWMKVFEQNTENATEAHLQNDTLTDPHNDPGTYFMEESGPATLIIYNVTVAHSRQYVCMAKYMNNTLKEYVDVTVIYMREPGITGETTITKGHVLNLTCSMESFPPSIITWTKVGLSADSHNGTALQNSTGSASLIIPNVTTDHSGQYICTAKYLDRTETLSAVVTVTWLWQISKSSGCYLKSEVLTCICISEGFPLPTIRWPLMKNHNEYSVTTTVSNYTVNSTISLTVKHHRNVDVECVSSNENGEAKQKLKTQNLPEGDTPGGQLIKRLESIIAFLIGVLLATVIFCLATQCHRKKQKNPENRDETVEMVTSQEDSLINDAVEDGKAHVQEGDEDDEAVIAEKTTPEPNNGPRDVEYASIDFSLLKRKSPREATKTQEATDTEYAEIKRDVKEEKEKDGEEEREMLAGVEDDEEKKDCIPEEEEEEDMAVYSSVKDVMAKM